MVCWLDGLDDLGGPFQPWWFCGSMNTYPVRGEDPREREKKEEIQKKTSTLQEAKEFQSYSDGGRFVLCVLQKLAVEDFWQLLSFHKDQCKAGMVKITHLDIISNSAWFSDSLISVIADTLAAASSILSSESVTEFYLLLALMHLSWFKAWVSNLWACLGCTEWRKIVLGCIYNIMQLMYVHNNFIYINIYH